MQRKQTLTLKIKMPNAAFSLKFFSVYEAENKLIAILRLKKTGGDDMSIKKIATVEVEVKNQSLFAVPVDYYVLHEHPYELYMRSKKFIAIDDVCSIGHQLHELRNVYMNNNLALEYENAPSL